MIVLVDCKPVNGTKSHMTYTTPTLLFAASSWWEVSSSSEMRRLLWVASCEFSSRRWVSCWRREECWDGGEQNVFSISPNVIHTITHSNLGIRFGNGTPLHITPEWEYITCWGWDYLHKIQYHSLTSQPQLQRGSRTRSWFGGLLQLACSWHRQTRVHLNFMHCTSVKGSGVMPMPHMCILQCPNDMNFLIRCVLATKDQLRYLFNRMYVIKCSVLSAIWLPCKNFCSRDRWGIGMVLDPLAVPDYVETTGPLTL